MLYYILLYKEDTGVIVLACKKLYGYTGLEGYFQALAAVQPAGDFYEL